MVGERIKKQRKLKGFTQKELAEKSGISISSIEKYESGRLNPSFKNAERIANVLNMGISYFYPAENYCELGLTEIEKQENEIKEYKKILQEKDEIIETQKEMIKRYEGIIDKILTTKNKEA